MCILFLYFCDKPSPDGYRLIMASNRDEFYFRPTADANFWEKNPNILAGMDLEQGKEGGTWLGMTTGGKFAAITNYRQAPKFVDPNAIGRGNLVPDFLKGEDNVESYLELVSSQSEKYNGFNLLVGKMLQTGETKVGWYCNVEEKQVTLLKPGIHVLSNKVLNCSWPKMAYGRERFAEILEESFTKQELIDKLMGLLNLRQRQFSCGDEESFFGPQDEGGNMKWISACQAIFVNCKEVRYGTRTNTVVLVDGSGHATYVERTMEDCATDPDEAQWRLSRYEFDIIQETGDCSSHKSPENLVKKGNKIGESERAHGPSTKKHLKRKLKNGTTPPVEPAKKAFVQE